MRIMFKDLIFESYVVYDAKTKQATRWYATPEDLESALQSPNGAELYDHHVAQRANGLGPYFADRTRWQIIKYLPT